MSENRGVAARIARLLVQKERPDEAVALLSAWAARGPNDTAGQGLLAEALRINPAAKAAQQAFERMEGIAGTHAELDAAIARFDAAELERLQKGLESPTFKRAQIGFNNNIRAKDQVFHIQTEDSGLNNPHVITHLFADGGRVIKSYKRVYAAAIETEADIGAYVRQLMKAQHLEMVFALRDGRFDDILAGKAVGGLELLEHYPDVDLAKVGAGGRGRARKAEPQAGQVAQGDAKEGRAASAEAAPALSTPSPSGLSAAAPAAPEPAPPAKGAVPVVARQRHKSGVVIAPSGAMPAAR